MSEPIQVETFGGTGGGGGGFFGSLLTGLGVCAIGFGVLVLVFPKILEYMVAGFFVLVGIGFLFAGRALKKARQRFTAFGQGFPGPGSPGQGPWPGA